MNCRFGRIGPVQRAAEFAGHWPINEFARSLLGSSSKHKAVAVLVGYFDENGISANQRVTLVGGAVADSVIWGRLNRPWARLLRNVGQNCYHAWACDQGEEDFSRTNRPLRDALTNGLSMELAKVPFQGLVSGVYRDDWGSAPEFMKRRFHNDPFLMAVEQCFQQISRWSEEFADGEPVAIVYARRQGFEDKQSAILSLYQTLYGMPGLGPIAFASPREVVPLQAADMICYEVYRRAIDMRYAPDAPLRQAMQNFERANTSIDCQIHDADSLQKAQRYERDERGWRLASR
jgi:hypothetical protein